MTTDAPGARLDRGRSLRLELLASLAMVLVLAVVSLSFAAELLGQRRHRELEIERIRQHTADLASMAAMRFQSGNTDPAAIENLVQQALGSSRGTVSIELFVFDKRGEAQTMARAGVAPGGVPPIAPEPKVHEDAVAQTGLVVIDEALPTFGGPNQLAVLRVAAELSPWTRNADWPTVLFLAGGVALVLLVLGGLLVEAQVLRPIRALKAGVARVTEGDLSTRVEAPSARELRELTAGFNDMTAALARQRQALEKQAGALQRTEHMAAVGRLSAGVAHEVGNPLAALLGYTELLLDPRTDTPLSEEQRELLERVRAQTQRIQSIVGQLLDYSRQRQRELERVDLREIADETLALLRVDPRAREVDVELVPGAEAHAFADRSLIVQVLLNLGINACLAATEAAQRSQGDGDEDRPARVKIALGEQGPWAWVEVRDSGPGVAEADRERIFEPFFSTRQAGEGTGLGLAISRGLVENMDGELICAREASLLGGATFVMRLPRKAPADLSRVGAVPPASDARSDS